MTEAEDVLAGSMARVYEGDHPACPHEDCGLPVDLSAGSDEMVLRHTTYHGEDGPKEDECPHCGRQIFVEEYVVRTYTLSKVETGE